MFNDINNNILRFYTQLSLTKQLFGSVHPPALYYCICCVFVLCLVAACHGEQDQGIPLKFIKPLHKQLIHVC